MDLSPRKISDSKTVISQVMKAAQANPFKTIHGGEMVKIMDNAAGICAIRHTALPVATKAINNILFHRPIFVGDLISCRAYLTYVKQKIMEIRTELHVEDSQQQPPGLSASGYFYHVALDLVTRKTLLLPPLLLDTPEEMESFEQGALRMEQIISR